MPPRFRLLRSLRLAPLTLVLLGAALAAGASADSPARSGRQQPLTEDQLEAEGLGRLRLEYFAERRKGPDPGFDAAAARLAAIRDLQRALGRGDGSGAVWTSIGPAPITGGQTPTSSPRIPSPVSGRVAAIAIDDVDDSIYVGGAQGGIWKSTDDGATWTAISDQLASIAIGSIAIDPAPHAAGNATIYIGTGEGNGSCDSYAGVGIYKSTDSGASWSGPFGGAEFTNRSVGGIAVDRNDSMHVLAVSSSGIFGIGCAAGPTPPDRGVFESQDGGATWTKRTAANRRYSTVVQDPFTATTWWASGWTSGGSVDPANEGGLVRSIDNGATWTQLAGTGGLPSLDTTWGRSTVTATSSGSASVLYLSNAQANGSIYKSTDSGASWTPVPPATSFCGGQCFYDQPLLVEPGDPSVFYFGGAGQSQPGVSPSEMMRSNDGGVTFTDLVRSADVTTALHADMHSIVTWPNEPNRLWVGNDGGVWRSDDRGTNWVDVNTDLALTQYSGCDLHPTDAFVAYGGTQDNGTLGWEGNGTEWKNLDFGDGGFALIDQGNPQNLVHTYYNQTNNIIGVGWTARGFAAVMGQYCFSGAPANGISLSDRVLFYAPIHLDRNQSSTLYFGTHRLYRSPSFFGATNCSGAGTFTALAGGQDLAPGGGALSAIETVAGEPDRIYTGSSNGVLFRSLDDGATFTQIDVGGSPLFVSDVIVDPSNSAVVYASRAGFSGAPGLNVRKSTNGGNTWAPAGSGLPDIPVNALAFDPIDPTKLWAGTDIGTYSSTDGGASWQPDNDGMATVAVFDLKSNPYTETIIACTHGRSTYRISAALFSDGFESGDTSEWSSTTP